MDVTGVRKVTRSRARTIARILFIISVLFALLAVALGASLLLFPSHTATRKAQPVIVQQPAPMTTSDQDAMEVSATARQFTGDLLTHNYADMWSLLDPRKQAQWPGEAAFATFWKGRFQDFTLQGFALGKVRSLSYWVDPETMLTYNNVEEIPVSLQLAPRPITHLLPLPPEDAHPDQIYQNLPFVVQKVLNPGDKGDRWVVLDGGPADLEAPILPPFVTVERTVRVPILMYHYTSTVPANDPDPALRASLSVSPQMLSAQLDYLKTNGYHSITLNQLMNALYYGAPLPARPIILSFDDGHEDNYQYAYPLLKAHGFSGVFYIITGMVGWQGQMTWPQLRTMLANGMQIGSHTVHHVDMGSVYLASPAQAQQEAQVSQLTLEKNLGIPIQHFCYPNGGPFKSGSLVLREEVVAMLTADGYVSATTDPGMTGDLQNSLTPLALLRIRVDGRSTLQFFIDTLRAYSRL
jgi:peptidoglycan/xylan/chitin deacetylase (PgdA/CDA1 family)